MDNKSIEAKLFLTRGVEYSTLRDSSDIHMDDVVLCKHTPINSKCNHIFFASPRQLLETSYMCPTCSGELELACELVHMVCALCDNPKLLDDQIIFVSNNKLVCIDYLGLTYMRNHKFTDDAIEHIARRQKQFDKYLYFTYHDLKYDMDRCKESLNKFMEDMTDEITSTHNN